MRTRNLDWFNSETNSPMYGIQIRVDGRWMNAAENGRPLLFDKAKDRNKKRAELRRIQSPA